MTGIYHLLVQQTGIKSVLFFPSTSMYKNNASRGSIQCKKRYNRTCLSWNCILAYKLSIRKIETEKSSFNQRKRTNIPVKKCREPSIPLEAPFFLSSYALHYARKYIVPQPTQATFWTCFLHTTTTTKIQNRVWCY